MAAKAFFTIAQLKKKLADVASDRIDLVDVLNEIGERAYAIGRWPHSTTEVTIATADKSKVSDSTNEYNGVWSCYIDADAYDGAIAFKVNGFGGYPIRPLSIEYRGPSQGWGGFIDLGLVSTSAGFDRRYIMPSGVTSSARVTAVVKKRWTPVYDDTSNYLIKPFAAIKAGVLATNYEAENEQALADAKWTEMEAILLSDHKQHAGVQQIKVSFNPPYTHKPRSLR